MTKSVKQQSNPFSTGALVEIFEREFKLLSLCLCYWSSCTLPTVFYNRKTEIARSLRWI